MAARKKANAKGTVRSPRGAPLTGIEADLVAHPQTKLVRARKQAKDRTAALPYTYDYFGVDRQELLDSERYPQLTAEAGLLRAFIKAATIYREGAKKHVDGGDTKVIVDTRNLLDLASIGITIAMQRESALLREVDELLEKEARADGRLPKRGPRLGHRAFLREMARHIGLSPQKPGRKPLYAWTQEMVVAHDAQAAEISRRNGKRPTDRDLITERLRDSAKRTNKRVTKQQIDGACKALSAARKHFGIAPRFSKTKS